MAKRYSVELISNYIENVVSEFHGITSPQTIGLQADLGDKNERFGHVLFPVYAFLHCISTYFAVRLFLEILIHFS